MDKEKLLQYVQTMISSSTKEPDYVSISTVKAADIFGVQPSDIEQKLHELVNEGKLLKSKRQEAPHNEIYLLPSHS